MKLKRLLALLLSACMLFVFMAACTADDDTTGTGTGGGETPGGETPGGETPGGDTPGDDDTTPDTPTALVELPRNETLYFGGMNWGSPNGWNGFSGDMNNALAIAQENFGARVPMFETPYMFNPLDGSLMPLLADGAYSWNDDRTELTFSIKAAAKWNDGTPVTAFDVAFTWEAGVLYDASAAGSYDSVIDKIEAVDASTVVIHSALNEEGLPVNPMMIESFLIQNYVLQQAWLETLIERTGGDGAAMRADAGLDIAFSGPYGPYHLSNDMVVLVRNDGYWGQDASMWGSLPVPKYLAHVIYEDNPATDVALAAGLVDVTQHFIANVQNLWLEQSLPISTYFENAPYNLASSASIPTAFFNMNSNKPGLDNPAVRRAIAIAVDYDLVIANAMTNQSPTFAQYPRSLMNPSAAEQALFDSAAVAHLQWVGNDIDGANDLLDEAGFLVGDSGFRYCPDSGDRLSYIVSCPFGWTDWEAAMEIVAAAGEKIGIEMTTYFPDWGVYQTVMTAASQDAYDIFMVWSDGASPVQPWGRVRTLMSSEFTGNDHNWSGNWGQYVNPRVDELIDLIPNETNQATLVAYYTELVEIYLTDIPSFSLMYRPAVFHTVSEAVWTGFTEDGDGRNVPPMNAVSGYGIADLYNLSLVG